MAGAYAMSAERARFFREAGCQLIALGSDQTYLARGIKDLLAETKGRG